MARPRIEITERDLKQLEVLAGFGLTLDKIALVLSISPRTLDRWLTNEEILARFKKGFAVAEAQVAKTLFEKAKNGDVTAAIWLEKSRFGRSDRVIETVREYTVENVKIYLPDNSRDLNEIENQRN